MSHIIPWLLRLRRVIRLRSVTLLIFATSGSSRGSFHEAVLGKHSPLQLPGVNEFVRNLTHIRDERPDLHFLASVDLAHKGLNFGESPLGRDFLNELEQRDRESLSGVEAGDADRFFATHQKDGGDRNYCGTPAIYTLLTLFPEKFELHSYVQCNEHDLSSTVTVASATIAE